MVSSEARSGGEGGGGREVSLGAKYGQSSSKYGDGLEWVESESESERIVGYGRQGWV